MPYQQYRQLQRHLQSPRRLIADPFQRECNPPEDPNWPTPTTFEELEELMDRLPHWVQVVCALIAAEMVLPIWEDWGRENLVSPIVSDEFYTRRPLTREQVEAPRQAIEVTWQWSDGEASDNEVGSAAIAAWEASYDAADDLTGATRAIEAAWDLAFIDSVDQARVAAAAPAATAAWEAGRAPIGAARAAGDAAVAIAAATTRPPAWAVGRAAARAPARAVSRAAIAARAAGTAPTSAAATEEFYREWWDLCRCRLAFILEARPFI